jgi:hypothetical protein
MQLSGQSDNRVAKDYSHLNHSGVPLCSKVMDNAFRKGLTISNRIILDVTRFYHVRSAIVLRKIFLFVINL